MPVYQFMFYSGKENLLGSLDMLLFGLIVEKDYHLIKHP